MAAAILRCLRRALKGRPTDLGQFPPDVARLLKAGGITHVSKYAGRIRGPRP